MKRKKLVSSPKRKKLTAKEQTKQVKDKIKVAIYCRVATEDNMAIDEQERLLKLYCERNGYKLYKSYIDNGYSGNNVNRPSYSLMLEDLKNKKFDLILTISINRISRSLTDFNDFLELVRENNCQFEAVNDKIDNMTMEGRLFTKMVSIMTYHLKKEVLSYE